MRPASAAAFKAAANMSELYELLNAAGMGPGWNKPEPSLWPSPRKNFVPARWQYQLSRPALDTAGKFVSTELAERRNLILHNPVEGNSYATVRTLVAAYQLVLAHETARSHRHTPNALRLVVDAGPDAYTIVDGRRIPMKPGDVLLTPNWAWHGHANEGEEPAFWIDFLDVPTNQFFEAMFFEPHEAWIEAGAEVDADSAFRFPFELSRVRLDAAAEVSAGRRVIELGPPRMATIGLFVERLDAGATADVGRSTANSIYAVIEGSGHTEIDGIRLDWSRGDVIAAPAWRPCRHSADTRSHLLRVTDEPMLRALNWLRTAP